MQEKSDKSFHKCNLLDEEQHKEGILAYNMNEKIQICFE